MRTFVRLLGSLTLAVPLLIAIAIVLAWGTIYETRFGTAAVQQVVYRSWWFQSILGFLAVNLAVAAFERYPWKRQHLPFVLAHLGIILILFGGILGGRFSIEGQLIIPEGHSERVLQLPHNVLIVRQPNPGLTHVIPTQFETRAWMHEPGTSYTIPLKERIVQLTVDRYLPDSQVTEEITGDGAEDFPAVKLHVSHEAQEEDLWLLAKDPERFGLRWGEAHLLFLEPATEPQLNQLLGRGSAGEQPRGVLSIQLPSQPRAYKVPVPEQSGQSVQLQGTPYTITLKDYFPDFAITEQGPASRSDQPNNPAVAFVLSGPEGTDAHLLFAFHPDFPALHGRAQTIPAEVSYTHPAGSALPPSSIGIIRMPEGRLTAVLTGAGNERAQIDSLELKTPYTHPWLGYAFELTAYHPRAKITQRMTNRSDEVRAEMLHLLAKEGDRTAEGWVGLRGAVELAIGPEPITVEYRPAERELPVTIKLSDFRKIDYPGTQMAAGFESDVQLTDPQRGMILMRKISMNNPLRYRGFSFYQSSYVPGAVETTILSVRNDPGTPCVYAGFLIVIAGVIAMFAMRRETVSA